MVLAADSQFQETLLPQSNALTWAGTSSHVYMGLRVRITEGQVKCPVLYACYFIYFLYCCTDGETESEFK